MVARHCLLSRYYTPTTGIFFGISGPYTLLVPTDAAFAKIPQADINALVADTNAVTNVLQYHLIKGSVFTWDLKTNELLTSVNGHVIRVYSRNGVSL